MRFLARHLTEEVENIMDVPGNDVTQMRDAIYECLALFLDLETAEVFGRGLRPSCPDWRREA